MLYLPNHLLMFRNCAFDSRFPGVGAQIDMQARSNKCTQRNTAFAALWVRMLTLASRLMQTLGKSGAALN